MGLARGTPAWIVAPWLDAALFILLYHYYLSHPLLPGLALLSALLALFLLWFFRDPGREIAPGLVSPADGVVAHLETRGDTLHLAVFMNPFNVHVNRLPLAGRITAQHYHRGGHAPAYRAQASANERLETVLETALGQVRVLQVAGVLVRRIVPYLGVGDTPAKGDRLGLVRFGSRVELELPAAGVEPLVGLGQRVKAGCTSLARLPPGVESPATSPPRTPLADLAGP